MATRKNQDGGRLSRLVSWLAVPRKITLPILLILSAGVGWLLWRHVDNIKLLAWLSGLASPFCTMCATVVWAMRDKLDDIVDTEAMSYKVYKKFERLSESYRNRSTYMASTIAIMSLIAATPAISNQLIGPVWEASVIAACMAVATSIFGYQLANYWDLQIRRYKNQNTLEIKKQAAQCAIEEDEARLATPSQQVDKLGMGWCEGPSLHPSVR